MPSVAVEGAFVVPSIINGLFTAPFYALISIPLVLSFRVSRTVAFVHGGIAILTGILFWWLTSDYGMTGSPRLATRDWPQWPALVLALLTGALLGFAYGALVMLKMRTWPRVTATTFSLGAMLFLVGITATMWNVQARVPSPLGSHKIKMFGQYVSAHQIGTALLVVAATMLLSLAVNRTRAGIYVRAMADDLEVAEFMGIPVARLGVMVWALSGALAALAGVVIMVFYQVELVQTLTVFLRALLLGVVGGFNSLPLILLGALIFSEIESVVGSRALTTVSGTTQELILIGILFVTVIVVNRLRPAPTDLLESQT